ncbi:GumC family protein [Ensifer adhaerens]|uniref:GumC family protein n=1 Tax=Ensifer adhaerens TaxID=106592 RepID=UPI000CF0D0BC|nr:GumC family protein [Ensifer adhaerens]
MFNIDDEKRPVPRASLLDFAADDAREQARARDTRAGSSLLDRLSGPAGSADRAATRGEGRFEGQQTSGETTRPKGRASAARGQSGLDGMRDKFARWLADRPPDRAAATAAADLQAAGDRPLVDIKTVLRAVWQLRKIILATTALGAVGGVLLALSTPSVFVSESKLYVDPREVRLTDSDLSKQSLATEGILALLDSQLEVLRSRTVMEKVAASLDLENDAEFAGRTSGGDASARVLKTMGEAIQVWRDPKTFIVTVEAKTRDPEKSALIANRLVETFLGEEAAAQSGFFQKTTVALDARIKELKAELDAAEKAVEDYKASNDIVGAGGELIADKQLLSLSDQVAAARNRIAEAKAKAEASGKVQLNDVLTGAYPEEINSLALSELRKQYAATRAQLSALDASLGPRHPQRIAVQQALEASRSEIANELRRIAAAAGTELDRAQRTEQDLVRQLAVQKARQIDSSAEFVELRELQRKAAATREIYESFLKRAGETREEEKLTAKNIRVISKAEPALQAKGPSRKIIVIAATMAGFIAGLGLGVLLGIYRSLNGLFPAAGKAEDDRAPEPPEPDGGPEPARRQPPQTDPASVKLELPPQFSPAAHHAQSLSAAYAVARRSVAPEPHAARPVSQDADEDDADIAKVQEGLRALRSRVEHYSRQKLARR